jgi:glycosyltransferase involved in cell wall biosynthesis
MRVFLVSPYHSGSHRAWAQGYASHSAHDVHLITMPGSFWQWRLTGSHVTLAAGIDAAVSKHGLPDVVLATSLVDLAGLRGMMSRSLGTVPTALYMHENQITYPAISRSRTERNYGLINWTSLLAADAVAFNSEFHRTSLMEALPGFLQEFPDERHHHLLASAADKTSVLPVGCDISTIPTGPKDDQPLVLWNHRWDPDKDPTTFLRIALRLVEADPSIRIALMGERFVNQRSEFDGAVELLGDHVVVDAHLERDNYLEVLSRCRVVVSTALQEFFGLSIVEAMAAGAFPVLPDRLVYPERVPQNLVDQVLFRSEDQALEQITAALQMWDPSVAAGIRAAVEPYDWSLVAPDYDGWLESIDPS